MPPVGSQLPARARGEIDDLEAAVGAAHDLLAGEAVALDRVGDQAALGIVERERPEPRLRRGAADVTSQRPSSALPVVIGAGEEIRRRRRSRPAVHRCARSSRARRGRCPACRSSAMRSRRRSARRRRRCHGSARSQVAPRPTAATQGERSEAGARVETHRNDPESNEPPVTGSSIRDASGC